MDIDADGIMDLMLSSFCGITRIFYGLKDGSFKKEEILNDETGNPVNMGIYEYGIKTEKFYSVDKKKAVSSRAVTAVDWDNDGDLDLVMNSFERIMLCINIGNKRKPNFSKEKILLPIHKHHFVYDYVDWNGDGLWDIITGDYEGGLFVYENKGNKYKPEFDKAKCLFTTKQIDPEMIRMHASQVRVCDYNCDGKKDILIGVNGSISKWKKGITEVEKAQYIKVLKEYKEISAKTKMLSAEIENKCGEEKQKMSEELQVLYTKIMEIFKPVTGLKNDSVHAFVYISYGK